MTPAAGLVLAAGEGRRFGGPKAPVVIDGERLVDRAVRVLTEGGCSPVVVVLGAWVGDVPGAQVVINPTWSSGMGSSLSVGLQRLRHEPDVDRALVTLVDLPGLTPAAVERLLHCTTDLAAAAYDGERGHPVLMGRDHWAAIAASASGDSGAKDYLRANPLELIEVGDIADGTDLDVPQPG